MTRPTRRASSTLFLLTLAVAVHSGCSRKESWQATTYPAWGTVTINGQPPKNAIITLHPKGEPVDIRHSKPYAMIDSNGRYKLQTYKLADGAPAGDYAMTLHWLVDRTKPSPDRLGGIYHNPDNPLMELTIVKGKNQLPPIDLQGVKVLPGMPEKTQ
jgi:hypothetical protein